MVDAKSPLLPSPTSVAGRRDGPRGRVERSSIASSTVKVLVGLGVLTVVAFHAAGPGASILATLSGSDAAQTTDSSWWSTIASTGFDRWDAPLEEIKDGKYPDTIKWKPCPEDKELLCARFPVPTDYDDPSAGTTYLALSKIPAKCPSLTSAGRLSALLSSHNQHHSCSLGTLMTNYGGPNVPGRSAAFTFGRKIHADVGGRYDLISWDPRGMGRTLPRVDCHQGLHNSVAFKANTVLEEMMDVPTPLDAALSPAGTESMRLQQAQALGLMDAQARLCGANVGAEVLKHMGTTTLIKDMARLSDVIDGKGALINFHGGSYGTVVASYLGNMLPHRVGKLVAHGVANPVDWIVKHYETYELLGELLTDAELTYDWYLDDCFQAGSKRCALAREGDESAKDIKQRVDDFLAELYKSPMTVADSERPGLLKSGMIRYTLFHVLQFPDTWSSFAAALDQAMHGNGAALRDPVARAIPPMHTRPEKDGFVPVGQDDLTRLAVSCADAPPYVKGEPWPTAEGMVEALQGVLNNVSSRFGATVHLDEQHGGCEFWPRSEKPVERFTGPWNATLANPVLIVSNIGDPITPARSGRDMARLWGDMATHVVQEAAGHSYLAPATPCYQQVLRDYFERGVVPKGEEYMCKVDKRESHFPADHKPVSLDMMHML